MYSLYLTMNTRKKILALIAGVITALLLIVYSHQDFFQTTSFVEIQKPATNAPALTFFK